MANTQINVTKNGTTILATAGKYCDRNIDVNVNVPVKATQFTNLYDPANVTLDYRMNCSSSSGITYTADTETNYVRVLYDHKAGEVITIRFRGIGTVRSRGDFVFTRNGGRVNHGQWSSYISNAAHDEYGDFALTFSSGATVASAWDCLIFNFQYPFYSSASAVLTGPIITINEPIGNGGHV